MRRSIIVLVVMTVALLMAGQARGQNLTCTGTVFNDVNSVTQPDFCGWIEWFSDLGITSGCSSNPPRYCPNNFVTRAELAVFVSKAMRGGHDNAVTFDTGTVGGGTDNIASGGWATVGGGQSNTASIGYSTVGGGYHNTASGNYSTVAGGGSNTASHNSTVAGGQVNTAGGNYSTVAGGLSNNATGDYSTVAGGRGNTASGQFSFAAGRRARADANGCFVWGDSTDAPFTCGGNHDRWVARASGGVFFFTNSTATTGVRVLPGAGAWLSISDRESKENFAEVNGRDILDRLSQIPIRTWNWKTQEPTIRHMGPVAQDFHSAFKVGEDDKHISTVDADGVALAAIQGLYQVVKEQESRLKEKDERIAQQVAEIRKQDGRIRQLEATLAEVLKRVSALEVPATSIAQK